jgi:hypothetical protein
VLLGLRELASAGRQGTIYCYSAAGVPSHAHPGHSQRNVRASPKSQVAPPSGSLRVLSRKVGPLGAERLSGQARAQMIETLDGHCASSKTGLEHGHARSEQLDGMLAETRRPW